MNYLAHLLLSGENEELLVGNFIGDFVKGSELNNYPEEVRKGIIIHREIDRFTDNHPKVKRDISLIRNNLGRYSPIAIDIYYDYLLCKNWNDFHSKPLLDFTERSYSIIESNKNLLPDKCRHMFTYMKRDNWLYNYRLKEGINRALIGLSKRTTYESNLNLALPIIEQHEETIEADYISFFTQLYNHILTNKYY